MSSGNQNETKIVFPSVSAQKQIAELKDLLARQKEHLDAVTTPEKQNPNCQNELVARQLQQAHKTVEALKQIGATHVRIKNCLTHDLPERPIEAICLDYWKRSNQIDYEIGKIDDKISSISQLIVTLQSVFPNAKPSLEVGQNENEPSGDGEQKRALSPLPHKLAVAEGCEVVVKSQLLPPLPIIEEEAAPETTRTSRDEAKTPADTEITPEAFVGAINEINDDKSKNSEELLYPNDSEEVLENPQDVLIKIADICDSLINGQENCVSWIQSERQRKFANRRNSRNP